MDVSSLGPVWPAVAFLLVAVPLAALLDEIGFFEAVAARVEAGRHLLLGLWLLAAATTAVLNLDTTVVLLTPLFARVAARHGRPLLPFVLVPALLACLASSLLPVSNLTNLIVAEHLDLTSGQFLQQLALPTVVAVAVGWWRYRAVLVVPLPVGAGRSTPVGDDAGPVPRIPVVGAAVVAFVLVGFVVGGSFGIPAWVVALAADLVLIVAVRRVPWRSVPVAAAAFVSLLALVVLAIAPHLPLDRWLHGDGVVGELEAFAVGAVGALAVNNLPAVLAALPALDDTNVWAFLLGVNLAPLLAVWGSLAGLLWLGAARRTGSGATATDYHRAGWAVGGPALLAALATRLVLSLG